MKQSKIQQFCEGVIEAGWLAALIIAPLFFNIYSSRVFEPDKISLIRSISLVMLLAYLVRIADGGRIWLPRSGPNSATGQADGADTISWRGLWRQPLLLPLVFLAVTYLVSSLLSIAPYVSWWGSYPRLQGTYTFISYLIIALLTAAHLRRPEQLQRLQHTIILTSLPIAIYGVIQHYNKDPLPWGGDVVARVPANAGNPIFLAAYLIMAFFLTLERVFSSFAYLLTADLQPTEEEAQSQDNHERALPPGHDLANVLAGGSYLFVLTVQLLAIVWTQSRGPWLGLASGLYIFVLLLLAGMRPRKYRFWIASWVGLGMAGAILLVLLNTTALGDTVRDVPYVGRLTTMLESDGGTGRVRTLIWQGVAEMVAPHQPLTYPDGNEDAVNFLRPLVGYGPETMWVVFTTFYPPELAYWEERNASPDRSHNETWDSLVITGFFGFLANSLLFLSIFFWAFRWLGLIRSRRDSILFFALLLSGGVFLSIVFLLSGAGVGLLGITWPTGLIVGLIVYVTLAVLLQPKSTILAEDRRRQLLIVASLAAIIAHYVEIHFGIGIAATRIYFWMSSALLVVLGMRWLTPESFAVSALQTRSAGSQQSSQQSRRQAAALEEGSGKARATWGATGRDGLVPSTVMPDLLVMMTLAFLYTANFVGESNSFAILVSSMTMRSQGQAQNSPGVLFLVIFITWIIATILSTCVAILRHSYPRQGVPVQFGRMWGRTFGLHGLILFCGWFIYGLLHAGRLVPGTSGEELTEQLDHIAGHFSMYTWFVVFWCLLAGLVLMWHSVWESRRALMTRTFVTTSSAVILAVITFLIVGNVNVALVRADVFYKQGQEFEGSGQWLESAELYRRALVVRPTEDHYMLALGRSLLESTKRAPKEGLLSLPAGLSLPGRAPSSAQFTDLLKLTALELALMGQEDLLLVTEAILRRAQEVNPLNTDHTANLARLYHVWAEMHADPQARLEAWETSLQYYQTALTLSPNTVHLWNEKGALLSIMGRTQEAEDTYLYSLVLDDRFEKTYLLLSELYDYMGEDEKLNEILRRGLETLPRSTSLRIYWGIVQTRTGDLEGALITHLEIIERIPHDLNTIHNLIILNRDLGHHQEAIQWAERGIFLVEAGQGRNRQNMSMDEITILLYRMLNELYILNGQLPQAVDSLQRLLELESEDFRHPLQLARIQNEIGNSDLARQFAETALALAPESNKPEVQAFLESLTTEKSGE